MLSVIFKRNARHLLTEVTHKNTSIFATSLTFQVQCISNSFTSSHLAHRNNRTLNNRQPVLLSAKRSFITMASSESNIYGVKHDWSFNLKPEDISKATDDLIRSLREKYDGVAALKDEDINFTSVVKAISAIEREHQTVQCYLEFPHSVSPNKELREASLEADRKLSEFDVEVSMRKDLFDKIVYFKENNKEDLNPESKRFVERFITHGRRNGLHLSKEIRDELKEIKKKMSLLGIEFDKNLNELTTFLEFDDEELVGMPKDFIDALEKTDSGKRKVTLKYPHFFPVLRKARNPETRRAMDKAFNCRCIEENTKILEELVELRHKQASLLSYENHARFVLEMRMAKNPATVHKFLTSLAEKLKPLWDEEKKQILKYKEEECKKYGYEYDAKINPWDTRYYTNMIQERLYAVDQEKLREYFPLAVVTKGLLEIYQELLNLKFSEIKNAKAWHEDVKMFSVRDATDDTLLGYFFLDLFPRDGKFGHAAIFTLQSGCVDIDGSRQVAVCSMEANFTKPTDEKPSLLDHNEVETYFHEFGHIMHTICAQAEHSRFGGTSVERDFVEAPSQMLENWCWAEEPLRKMSSHYKDGSPLPSDMLNKLIASRNANAGHFNLRQITFGIFDHLVHTSDKADTRKVYAECLNRFLQISPQEGTNFAAGFSHIAGGYDAQYYGYMWSEVFSMDMFCSRFEKEGVMNRKTGLDYRNCILRPGGSKDAADMLKDFLGREPNQEAFLKSKGLQV